jgi:hypothetical protein
MRRIIMAIASVLAFVLAAPGMALAHHHHARGHHGKHHARHRAHGARVIKFAPVEEGKGGEGEGAGSTETTTTSEGVGTVLSFEGNVLKIKLNDGSEVGGKVTEDTHLVCISPTAAGSADDEGAGDDQSADDEGDHHGDEAGSDDGSGDEGGETSGEDGSTPSAHDSSFEGGDGSDDDEGAAQSCETSALTPGTMVREAELRITSSGGVWESVVLMLK